MKERAGALLRVIRDAAPADPDIAALWERIQTEFYDNLRADRRDDAPGRALRRGLDVDSAADILWTLNHPDLWQLLVVRRGWTPDRFERWTADTVCEQLLRPDRPAI